MHQAMASGKVGFNSPEGPPGRKFTRFDTDVTDKIDESVGRYFAQRKATQQQAEKDVKIQSVAVR